jgi:hypothetical protein
VADHGRPRPLRGEPVHPRLPGAGRRGRRAARHEEELRAGLDDALVRPLAAAVADIGARATQRGEPIDADRLALLGSVLEAFWWQRYTAAGDGAMAPDQVERVVDDVLLPIAAPTSHDRRQEPATV